jgi:hypothetical protein
MIPVTNLDFYSSMDMLFTRDQSAGKSDDELHTVYQKFIEALRAHCTPILTMVILGRQSRSWALRGHLNRM